MLLPVNLQTTIQPPYRDKKKKKVQPSFKAIQFISLDSKFKHMKTSLLNEITTFHKNKSNAKFLGQGLFSKVYELSNLPQIVIKESLSQDVFTLEDFGLQKAPKTLKTSQQYVGRVYDDEDLKHYLLSTKINGISANPLFKPWNQERLKNLFAGLYEMDIQGFFHGDLNNGNIKIDNNDKVGFLDYQWATKLELPYEQFIVKSEQCLPDFIPTMNAQMFEMAAIPYYARLLTGKKDVCKEFLSVYLKEKAQYHLKRMEYFSKHFENFNLEDNGFLPESLAMKFEKAQSEVLSNPTEKILKLESKKIQFLSSFREAFRHIDVNTPVKNILNAPSAYLMTLSNIQWFKKEIAQQGSTVIPKSESEVYLKGMERYGDFWFNNLKRWTEETFESVLTSCSNPSLYINNEIEKFRPMTNFLGLVDNNYQPIYTKNFEIKDKKIEEKLEILTLSLMHKNDDFLSSMESSHNKLVQTFENLKNSYYQKEGAFTVLNKALVLYYNVNKTIQDLRDCSNLNNSKPLYTLYYLFQNSTYEILTNIFNKIYTQICENGVNSDEHLGYKNMHLLS